jgi:hypothetical protein
VIEDYVQDNFDVGLVKSRYHFLKLQLLLPQTTRTALGRFGRKENHGT